MAKPYGLANQNLCYIQMLLNIEKSGEYVKERSREWLVNTRPDYTERTRIVQSGPLNVQLDVRAFDLKT